VDKTKFNHGHRKRLRERFLSSGIDSLHDYEVIELLLTLGTPRKDCKLIAKEILEKYKQLVSVLNTPTADLQKINGVGPNNVFGVKLFQELFARYSKEKVSQNKSFASPEQVYNYLRQKIGKEKKEHFVVLCIDAQKRLINCDVSVGILNASLVHPREVFEQAILNHASSVIVAHNHPSGDSKPSTDDILTTKRLVQAGKLLGITVMDHMIVTANDYYSMKKEGVVELSPTLP